VTTFANETDTGGTFASAPALAAVSAPTGLGRRQARSLGIRSAPLATDANREKPAQESVVNTKITSDVLESYLKCTYKGHLKLAGEQGTKTDYELMLVESRRELRTKVTDRLYSRCAAGDTLRGPVLSRHLLEQGAALVVDGLLESNDVSLVFDGLIKTNGTSRLGDFHYIPLLHYEGGKIRQEQRLLLAVYSLILAPVQGVQPASGIIAHGEEGRLATAKLTSTLIKKAQYVIEGIRHVSGLVPKLMLNEHCNVCEVRWTRLSRPLITNC
jgi:predicted RecB family nuclease